MFCWHCSHDYFDKLVRDYPYILIKTTLDCIWIVVIVVVGLGSERIYNGSNVQPKIL